MNTNWKNKSAFPLPVVLLFGPTAVGKTEIINPIFKRCGEVINADSLQVYRGMNIGTAKPRSAVLSEIPHHLVDIKTPNEKYDVGEFIKRADILIPEIIKKDKIPVVSGGTAFYIKNFLFGISSAPPSNRRVRESIKLRLNREGSQKLFEELSQIDPDTAQRISSRDVYSLTRALEVYEVTGKPLSSFKVPDKKRSKYTFLLIGLNRPRPDLYRRIEDRIDEMFKCGLVQEVKNLLAGGVTWKDPGMRGIGYREFHLYAGTGCMLRRDVEEHIKRNTRRYAKRQLTFFRRLPDVQWFHPENHIGIDNCVKSFLSRNL